MKIILARTAGFCFGVNKAIEQVLSLLDKDDAKVYTLGPIIHNEDMVSYLSSKGVTVVKDICEMDTERDGDSNETKHVVIRTHGVTPQTYKDIEIHKVQMSDATCPYVKKIHNLVKEKHDEGYKIIIIGDRNHPEVVGINGWCDNTGEIVDNVEEADMLVGGKDKACIVSQTTMTMDKWNLLCSHLESKYENLVKYNTICSATSSRQEEAASIAKSVDAMIVIGSSKSSNTQKLYEICKNHCPETYNVKTADDLPFLEVSRIGKIGVTAGASTPEWIIREVVAKMEEQNNMVEQNDMVELDSRQEEESNSGEQEVNFKDALEDSLVTLQSGSIIKGKIIGYNEAEVFVDLGYKSDGVIPMEQFSDDPDFRPDTDIKVGDQIEIYINRVNDKDGVVELSKKKVDALKNWSFLEEAYKEKSPVSIKIIEETNGGLIGAVKGIRVFIPASQVGERYLKDFKDYLSRTISVRIIEFNKNRKKVVGSERILLTEERKILEDELWASIEAGKSYKGRVRSLTNFGAFVDIGGVDGLIHISEMSWSKIKHPSDIMKVNDEVEVTILDFDREKSRISLGYRKHEDNPWNQAKEKYKVGDIVSGKVVRLVPFGAFVELEKGLDGLVHISQISSVRIAKPGDVLHTGQIVGVKILELNIEAQKISLSIREVEPINPDAADITVEEAIKPAAKERAPKKPKDEEKTEHMEDMSVTIGDMLSSLKTAEMIELKEEIALPREKSSDDSQEVSGGVSTDENSSAKEPSAEEMPNGEFSKDEEPSDKVSPGGESAGDEPGNA